MNELSEQLQVRPLPTADSPKRFFRLVEPGGRRVAGADVLHCTAAGQSLKNRRLGPSLGPEVTRQGGERCLEQNCDVTSGIGADSATVGPCRAFSAAS